MKTRKEYTCPLELTHDVIKGKWKPIIMWQLWQHQSLSELKEGIAGISQKMLIEQLKELMEYGMVDKKSCIPIPILFPITIHTSFQNPSPRIISL